MDGMRVRGTRWEDFGGAKATRSGRPVRRLSLCPGQRLSRHPDAAKAFAGIWLRRLAQATFRAH